MNRIKRPIEQILCKWNLNVSLNKHCTFKWLIQFFRKEDRNIRYNISSILIRSPIKNSFLILINEQLNNHNKWVKKIIFKGEFS